MDIDTLARIFPTGVVSSGNTDQGGFFEVCGLPQGTVPEFCEMLASGQNTQWSPVRAVTLNPERDCVIRAYSGDNPIQQLAA